LSKLLDVREIGLAGAHECGATGRFEAAGNTSTGIAWAGNGSQCVVDAERHGGKHRVTAALRLGIEGRQKRFRGSCLVRVAPATTSESGWGHPVGVFNGSAKIVGIVRVTRGDAGCAEGLGDVEGSKQPKSRREIVRLGANNSVLGSTSAVLVPLVGPELAIV